MNVQNKWFTAPVSVITSASWKNLHVSVMDLSDFSYRLPPRTKWRTNDASGFVRRAIVIGLSTLRALRSILIYRFLSQIVDSLLRESRHADIPDTVLLPEGIPPAQRKRAYRPSIVSGSPNFFTSSPPPSKRQFVSSQRASIEPDIWTRDTICGGNERL